MNQLIELPSAQTMTSREIAELLDCRHDTVKISIERLATTTFNDDRSIKKMAVIQPPPMAEYAIINGLGITTYAQEYLICKRDSYIIVAQLSPEFTAKLVDRWQELEAKQAPVLPSYPEALRALASSLEQVGTPQALIEQQAPAVAFVERYVEARSSKCLSDVAKLLKHKPHAFIAKLALDKVIFLRGGSWIPFQEHIDKGRFTVTTGEANKPLFQPTRGEPDGIVWLAGRYPA